MVFSLREGIGPAGSRVLDCGCADLVVTESKSVTLNKISLIPLPGSVDHFTVGVVTTRCNGIDGFVSDIGGQVKVLER